jgi:two-component system sensor histidine kinase TctE
LATLETKRIPAELMPLVATFNDYIQRIERHTNHQSMFLQNAAHQLRTPLTVLNTQISDALQADDKPQAEVPLVAARKTLQQTVRLVNQFLTLSSAEGAVAGQKRLSTEQCVEIIRQVLEDLAVQAHSKQMDLGFERGGSDTVIKTDPSALREITINLVENALRYTPPSGVVTVQVQSAADSITLIVEDNGPGVAKEDHEKIFQRFFRVGETDSAGSGLGLAIVKELATQCGAQIQVGSPPLGGHGFWIAIKFVGR